MTARLSFEISSTCDIEHRSSARERFPVLRGIVRGRDPEPRSTCNPGHGMAAVFGALTFLDAPALAANAPTPHIGLWERINMASYAVWMMVFAVALLSARRCGDFAPARPAQSWIRGPKWRRPG